PSKAASPRRFPARVPDGSGPIAPARLASLGDRAASAVGPAFRGCFADRQRGLPSHGLRRQPAGMSPLPAIAGPPGRGGQNGFAAHGLCLGAGSVALGALLWSWRLGKGTDSEHDHLRSLLGTLPTRALIVADAFYQGYDLYAAILAAQGSFLVRLSSRSRLYTADHVPLDRFRQTLVYFWPEKAQSQEQPPLQLRVVRVRGKKTDVWLLTNVLDPRELNHRQIAQLYRWRWRNEGLFRYYKRMLGK